MSSYAFDKHSTTFPMHLGLLALSPKLKACDLFWLDILCIPTKTAASYGPLTQQLYLDLRQQAISQISAVFAGAAQVLIMDAEMQTLRRGTSQLPEIYAHFLGCNWSTRAWTFQEMSQSLKCSVQLLDGAGGDHPVPASATRWFVSSFSFLISFCVFAFTLSLAMGFYIFVMFTDFTHF